MHICLEEITPGFLETCTWLNFRAVACQELSKKTTASCIWRCRDAPDHLEIDKAPTPRASFLRLWALRAWENCQILAKNEDYKIYHVVAPGPGPHPKNIKGEGTAGLVFSHVFPRCSLKSLKAGSARVLFQTLRAVHFFRHIDLSLCLTWQDSERLPPLKLNQVKTLHPCFSASAANTFCI